MTREEAKNIAYTWDTKATVNYEIKSIIFTSQAVSIIDKIYDDFESRTCENCEYFIDEKDTKLQFCNARTEGGIIGWNGYGKDFGCNKFERKTDE